MADWLIEFHDDFFKDLDKLLTKDILTFEKKKKKILANPLRQKHLGGGNNCYREPITDNIRLIYFVKGKTIWMLTVGPHDSTYSEFKKRLYSLKAKYRI